MPKDFLWRDLTAGGTADFVGRANSDADHDWVGRELIGDWAISTAVVAGDLLVLSTGEVLRAVAGGTTDAAAEPAAPGYGNTVIDGTVTWEQVSN